MNNKHFKSHYQQLLLISLFFQMEKCILKNYNRVLPYSLFFIRFLVDNFPQN